jgi:hypothetical protein
MPQPRIAAILVLAVLAVACGGGHGPGPTEPGPPAAPIVGTWTGSLVVFRSDGSSVNCDLTLDFTLQQKQAYSGTYTVTCGGSREDGVVAASLATDQLSFDAVLRTANSSHPPLDSCPWGGQLTQNGTRLFGSWEGGGCNGSTIVGGPIDVGRTGGP